ncbi:MAG: HAD family hydrolase [Cryomorphaceae bacterium]|nr:MAG: HAD family hydrolase [Cryomorphaceae bacterium]
MDSTRKKRQQKNCFHCGDTFAGRAIEMDDRQFCCQGCATVYELLSENGMDAFYTLEDRPGVRVEALDRDRYAFLDLPEVAQRLLQFEEGKHARVTLRLPAIHCSSCIWLLENLHRINPAVISSGVHFTRKQASILFNKEQVTLRQVVELLVKLGYPPEINLSTFEQKDARPSRKWVIKIGVAGFCFGNIMLLSLPEYLGMGEGYESYAMFFGALNILLALPVFFYAATDYYRSAWASLRSGQVNIDVPITLGIFALFGRSLYEILSQTGAGYMDSLAGLLFFLLIGKWFQEKTYQSLAFDRNYESYFPVAARVVKDNREEQVPLKDLKPGMEIIVRNRELIPADSLLVSDRASIDFSFVTGESQPVQKNSGDLIYAGGRQSGTAIRLRIEKPVDQSYLTDLWNQQVFRKADANPTVALINKVSRYFTMVVLLIAALGGLYWILTEPSRWAQVVTAVLIVACPCALALAAPFSFGHTLRAMGRNALYLRNSETVETMAAVTDIVFDKTGTLTRNDRYELEFIGAGLTKFQEQLISSLVSQSSHPLSRVIDEYLDCDPEYEPIRYKEVAGAGLQGMFGDEWVVVGSEQFVTGDVLDRDGATRVFVKIGGKLLGYFLFEAGYRSSFQHVLEDLSKNYRLHLLSGDGDRERFKLSAWFDEEQLHFSQTPFDKLAYVEKLQRDGRVVMMLGDGLNDSGALQAANVGISIADNVYDFTPACDAIFDGREFGKLPGLLFLARGGMKTVRASMVLSFFYNVIGLSFALSGMLSPLVAAILMPVSSISVVVLATLSVNNRASKALGEPGMFKAIISKPDQNQQIL